MPLPIDLLLRRHMKPTAGFSEVVSNEWVDVIPLRGSESLLGVYRNPEPHEATVLVFSTESLFLVESGAVAATIGWRTIVGFDVVGTAETASAVVVQSNQESFTVPLHGTRGPDQKYRDAISFAMVASVLTNINSRRNP